MKQLILKVFECKHCKAKFVIVKAQNTLIPVNVNGEEEYPIDTIFERATMKSHLKGCAGRRGDWQKMKEKYLAMPELRYAEKEVQVQVNVQVKVEDEKRIRFEKILQEELKEKGLR